MLNLLARMKLYFKEVFSNSINLFRNKKRSLSYTYSCRDLSVFFGQSMTVLAFHNLKSQRGGKKKKRSYALLLTSKQVYKLIQRAVILKIFYV